MAEHLDGALAAINEAWWAFFEDSLKWITSRGPMVSSFTSLVYPGKWHKLMSETSVMISPTAFKRFVRPALQWQIDRLERSIFNLDGLGQAHLLDEVLSLKRLSAV